ncbi:MAG TPA: M23 family metallopeptidase [Candidatus Thiothrix moscowensis]|uniref:M23 family metallopeptidase n=1 Tax=unclassified Thiothrix TaxID=2636184 RepID=UPI001A2769EA|nr:MULTISPECIES: M23 family metallopeptidase [unclassified Thiothrix]MBJ6609278.1 M23 family metallopeptidase [Candidatus Thiothrix moscowensis]HRJ51675.1 M23 family metallopeptidase [Candidatus Thiothrix moscowensis]HRJ91990.1 M23 family metallopeptidase [Candidatus Thiothrix moscowensis]
MKVICLSEDGSRRASFSLHPWKHLIIPSSIVALLIIGLSVNQMLGLYKLDATPQNASLSQAEAGKIISALEQQVTTVDQIKKAYANYTVDVDTLSTRLGSLEAEIARLNALAKRVAGKAKLDPQEFSLDEKPARGGADEPVSAAPGKSSSGELLVAFQSAENSLDRQRGMLVTLEQILEGITLEEEVLPSGRPVRAGYISSEFGFRRDPFNGRSKMHKGIDYAGPTGTDIYAVGGGVVSFVGNRGDGYGNVVEVDHGDGLVSRYAHLNAAKVVEGQVIKKGDMAAWMGNSGRSTGSHLHLEVLKNGEQVNPRDYLGYEE